MRKLALAGALGVAIMAGTPAWGQWESPTFFAPTGSEDIGVYAFSPDAQVDWGFVGIWRQGGNINLGVRAGVADDSHYMVGAELFGPLALLGPQSPVLISWITGLGATFNDVTALRIPLGVSAGVTLGQTGMQLTPYVHPRGAFDLRVFDVAGEEETETEFNFDIDVGAELGLGQSFVLRVAATLGDREAFGAGVAYRLGRSVAVR